MLNRKDFLAYLANGGDINFRKPIKFNKAQYNKRTDNQKVGKSPVMIDGVEGFINQGVWIPRNIK